jgi:hypothetical protein
MTILRLSNHETDDTRLNCLTAIFGSDLNIVHVRMFIQTVHEVWNMFRPTEPDVIEIDDAVKNGVARDLIETYYIDQPRFILPVYRDSEDRKPPVFNHYVEVKRARVVFDVKNLLTGRPEEPMGELR